MQNNQTMPITLSWIEARDRVEHHFALYEKLTALLITIRSTHG